MSRRVCRRRESFRVVRTVFRTNTQKSEGRYRIERRKRRERVKRFPLRSTRNKRKERRKRNRPVEATSTGVDRLGPSFAFGSVFCGAGQEGSVLKTNEDRSR